MSVCFSSRTMLDILLPGLTCCKIIVRGCIYSKFSSKSNVFVIDLRSKDVLRLHARDDETVNSTQQSLILMSKDRWSNNDYRTIVKSYIQDPNCIVVALPGSLLLSLDGAKLLWIERTILKWMKAVKETCESHGLLLQSKL